MDDVLKSRLEVLANVKPGTRLAAVGTGNIYALLKASECLMIDAYNHSIESGSNQQPLHSCDGSGGYPELGPVLYWLNNPPTGDIGGIVKGMVGVLEIVEGGLLPASRITPAQYESIKAQAEDPGIVASDGTIYGESQYEQFDPRWLYALLYFLYYQVEHDKVHPFGTTPQKIPLSSDGDSVTIAVVGDWGTGRYGADGGPALAVLADMQSLNPDYVIHLGDVYYAGTEGGGVVPSEERDNFIDLWPPAWGGATGKSFTLNSNHEMYDGANGYFKVALAGGSPFAQQKETSYFALTYGPWTILCLDSAYYADADELFMIGSIGGANGEQYNWIHEHFGDLNGKNVIVMSHHNAVDYTGETTVEPFWSNVCDAIGGGGPAYWYWGHIHNAMVYAGNPAGSGTKLRCLGHGAIPFGNAWGLQGLSGIDYYAHTAIPGSIQVRNGFATLTLTSNGGITERFYETTGSPGSPKLAWSS